MKSPRMYLALAFLLAFGVLALIPIWYALDAIKPEEGGHQEHGGGATVSVEEFESKVEAQMEKYGLPDGSVRLPPGDVYILVTQFVYVPNNIRLKAGALYTLLFLSKDVLHGASLIKTRSLNSVIMPGMVTAMTVRPMQTGEILMLCNEYCGVRHHAMRAKIIVEEAARADLHEGDGVVVDVQPQKGHVVLNHGEIKDFMAAMEGMSYVADPPTLLRGLKPGDKVRFGIDPDTRSVVKIAPVDK